MLSLFTTKLAQWKSAGWLTIILSLLFELLIALWLGFLSLFTLETLLPTFVTIRVSLTTFLWVLLLLSLLYLSLKEYLNLPEALTKTPRFITWGVFFFGAGLILLSLARFSLFAGGFFLIVYVLLWWYFRQGAAASTSSTSL